MSLSINVKNSLLLISEKIIILGMAFFSSVLLARIGGPEVFGQFSYITSFVALFVPFCVMGLNNITTKYFVKYPKHSHHFFLTALAIRLFGAFSCIIIGSISAYILGIENQQLRLVTTLLILQSFTLFYLVEFYFLAKRQVIYTLTIRLVVIILLGAIKIFIILNGADLYSLVVIHGLEFVCIGLGYLILYFKQDNHKLHQISKKVNQQSIYGLFHKGKWLLLSGVAAALYLKMDQVMIAEMQGTEQVAYYAAAAKLSEFWYVFPILIANAFNAKLIKLKQKNNQSYQEFILQILSVMVGAALIISISVFILASPIIRLIYGLEYQTSATILSIHIFATIFIFQRAILSKWLIIEGNYKFSLYSHGAGALSNIGLNILLIPLYGGIGAAWATLFSYMIASFLSLALTKQTLPFMKLMCKAMLTWPANIHKNITSTRSTQ